MTPQQHYGFVPMASCEKHEGDNHNMPGLDQTHAIGPRVPFDAMEIRLMCVCPGEKPSLLLPHSQWTEKEERTKDSAKSTCPARYSCITQMNDFTSSFPSTVSIFSMRDHFQRKSFQATCFLIVRIVCLSLLFCVHGGGCIFVGGHGSKKAATHRWPQF